MDRYEISGFRFNKLFNRLEIVDSRIKDGYIEYRITSEDGRYHWVRRYGLVWKYYKKEKRKYGRPIHHKNMNKCDDRPSNLVQITRREHCAIHGKIYSVIGEGGSNRNLGTSQTDRAKGKIADSMLKNNNMPIYRDEKWCARIKSAQRRICRKGIRPEIRKIVELYVLEKMSYRDISSMMNLSVQVVRNRIAWFIEDNFDKKIGFEDLRRSIVGKDLDCFIFYDEQKRLEDTLRYKVIKERVCKGRMQGDIADMLKIKDNIDDIVRDFYLANGLCENTTLKSARKVIRDRGLSEMVGLMKD